MQLEFSLLPSSGFGFFLFLDTRFFVVFPFSIFRKNPGSCALSFKSLQSILQRFAFSYFYLSHYIPPLILTRVMISFIINTVQL